jgi:threonine dehydratase
VAAVRNGKIKGLDGKHVAVVLTGGNVDTSFLAKVLLRGLEKDGRLAKLVVVLPDRPGSFAEVATIAAAHKGNLIDIHQRRTFTSADYRETEIEMLVETRGPEQAQALLDAISAKGFRARSLESDLLG